MYTKFLSLTLLTALFISCAKEKEYDDVYKKPETHSKSEFLVKESDGQPTKYLYVPMTLGTPREVAKANPFYQGQVKLVNIDFTEAGLAVHEIEKDLRFSDNDLNKSPVLLIPGEYKDYRCSKDEYGDCTNKEEENTEVTWDQKRFFLPDFKSLKVQEVNSLDLHNIDGDSCVRQEKVELVDYEISNEGVINIELEKTYKVDRSRWVCIRRNYFDNNLSASSFKVRFFYSMVKLDKLASKDYEPLNYPIQDHSVYGFFKSEDKRLNNNFDSSRKEIKYFVNRWNPKKRVLKYYLSKSYNKPKNKAILDVTMKSMHIMNRNLATAGAGFRLEFIQQTDKDNISPGDLRYNTIVLIDDPLANGLLGYAPSVKNPETGEIVQSHINMYGGVLKSGTKFVYEQAIDVMRDEMNAAKKPELKTDVSIAVDALVSSQFFPTSLVSQNAGTAETDQQSIVVNKAVLNSATAPTDYNYVSKRDVQRTSLQQLKVFEKASLLKSTDLKQRFDDIMSGNIENIDEIEKKIIEEQMLEDAYSLDETLAPEFFSIAGTVKVVYPGLLNIKDILGEDGILKPWAMLTESQKDQVAEAIMVNRYASTFVHEMGHSLGLRHNFAGSTDAANFYTDVEAQVLGMLKAPAYSSVMDYAVSEYNELGAFGKYDVAALMYAYSEKMQTKDGQGVSIKDKSRSLREIRAEHNANIEKDSGKAIISYEYCTDENAGLSTKCNRHDEGTTLVEIATQRIDRYKKFYKLRNFRDGKNSFTAFEETSYFIARYKEFFKLRDMLEDYEFYTQFYSPGLMENGCNASDLKKYPAVCARIQDRSEAVKIVGDFFIEILKTPDLICAVAKKDEPKVVASYKRLADIYDDIKYSIDQHVITSCFDENVKKKMAEEDLLVIGENGKFLNGFKDTNPEYKYSTDWSVRGIWADKVMAFRMLYQRVSGVRNTDTEHMALIDIPYIKVKVENFLEHIVLGKPLADPIPFKTESGDTFKTPYVIGNDYIIRQLEDNQSWLKRYTGMPRQGDASLTQIILNQLRHVGTSFSDDIAEKVYAISNYVTVRKERGFITPANRIPGLESLFTNDVTYQMGQENTLAFYMATAKKMEPILSHMGQEKVLEIFKSRVDPDAPEELNESEKLFFKVQPGLQRTMIQNAIKAKTKPEEKFKIGTFNATFGKENGKILFDLFNSDIENDAKNLIAIFDLKMRIMNVPAEGATAEEQILFDYDLPVLSKLVQDFINGAMSPEVFEFYDLQLRKLPNHFNRANI